MKRILSIIGLVFTTFICQAQTFPITQQIGSGSTLVKTPNYGGMQSGIIPYTFADTSAANTALTFLKTYNGALIYSQVDSALYFRANNASKWVQILPSGGSGGQRAWLDGGNSALLVDANGNGVLGTISNLGISFKSNSISRFVLDKNGILDNSGSGVKLLAVDTSSGIRRLVFAGSPGGNGWLLTGNSGTTAGTNFIGTTDAVSLVFKLGGVRAGFLDINNNNTSFGNNSLPDTVYGANNTAIGAAALKKNGSGEDNVSVGASSLANNATGSKNTSVGTLSLLNNTSGSSNIGLGKFAGYYPNLSSRLYINSFDRKNISGDTTKSILYGYQDAVAANQRLYANAQFFNPYIASQYNGADSMVVVLPSTGMFGYRPIPVGNTYTATLPISISGGNVISMPRFSTTDSGYVQKGTSVNKILHGDGTWKDTTASSGISPSSGTTNYVAKWTPNGTTLGNSSVQDNGSLVTVTNPLTVTGEATIHTLTVGLGAGSVATNTAVGYHVLNATATGTQNTGVGYNSNAAITSGDNNVALGAYANGTDTSGYQNQAIGSYALGLNKSGYFNSAVGHQSMNNNTTGYGNVGLGVLALWANTTGSNNTALGFNANVLSASLSNATAIGANANIGLSNAISLGDTTLSTKVGIGTAYPTALLDVRGSLRVVTGNQGANKILQSDASGNADWVTNSATSGSGTQNYLPKWTPNGTTLGNSQIFDNGTNVGIGTSAPGAKLDVVGTGKFSDTLFNAGNQYNNAATGVMAVYDTVNHAYYHRAIPTATITSPAGNYGNIQINRNSAFASPASDSLNFSAGLAIKGSLSATAAVNLTGLTNVANSQVLHRNSSTGLITWADTTASSNISPSSGTTNYVAKWTPNGTTLGNSGITDDGTTIRTTEAFTGKTITLSGVAASGTPLSVIGEGGYGILKVLSASGGNGSVNIGDYTGGGGGAVLNFIRPSGGAAMTILSQDNTNFTINNTNGSGSAIINIKSNGGLLSVGSKTGVNNSSPDSTLTVTGSLHVTTNSKFDNTLAVTGTITTPTLIGGTGTTSTLTYKTTTGVGTTGADHIFLVGNNGGTEAMRILNNGNVGIGTTSPDSTLTVTGSGRFSTNLKVGSNATIGGSLNLTGITNVANSQVLHRNSSTGLITWADTTASSGISPSSGTTNYVAKWTPNGTTLGNSQIFDDGTSVVIGGTTSGSYGLYINAPSGSGLTMKGKSTLGYSRLEMQNNSTTGDMDYDDTWHFYNPIGTSKNAVVSSPAIYGTGTWYTGGTATTTKPYLLIEPTGTTSTAWSTSGTGLGVNAASGFTGNLIDAQVGGVSKFSVTSSGNIVTPGTIQLGISSVPSKLSNTGNGRLMTDGSLFQFAGTNTSFPAINRSGVNLQIVLADNSALTGLHAATIGIGTTSPNSTLHNNGSFATAYVEKTANYTATSSDYTINFTSGTDTLTLPTAVGITGRIYTIVNSGANVNIKTTSSQTFVNIASFGPPVTNYDLFSPGASQVQSTGANWMKLN